MNRRDFLASGAAGLALTQADAAFADRKPPRVGLIGCGWYGKIDLLRLIQVAPVEVVSLCDVDKKMLAAAAGIVAGRQKSKKKPRTYADYRDMLKEKDLDIVLVATPDHWHALPMIAALEAGADVWVQKPIGVDVSEGRAMLAAARKHKRVVQVGTQRRSTPHIIEARDRVLKEGRLGKVALAEVYCYYHMRAKGNPPDTKPPEYLDYEMWTGPAPMRPYNEWVHPRRWRAFMEYGNGILGDMCIHMFDMVRWMLGLGWPRRIASSGGILVDKKSKANITDTQTVTFDYGDLPVVWQHRAWGEPPDYQLPRNRRFPWGATLYGEKGTLRVDVDKYEFTPAGKDKPTLTGKALYEYDRYPEDEHEKDLERHVASAVRGHMRDFLRAIETRGRPVADIEQGHISTASCILANLALQLGRSLVYDPTRHVVTGDEEATKLLARPYRKPWVHPET
ncbi:MAG TPA: Gfo/Idh/MocA family oxidoreductase [Gemmataceae bacterium]|nr:Gfo/Idh/MocA family oxidoreductase [Gemmataceae bacterium]